MREEGRGDTGTRIYSGGRQGLETSGKLKREGDGAPGCGGAHRGRGKEPDGLGALPHRAGPAYGPVLTWLSALLRAVCSFWAGASHFGVKGSGRLWRGDDRAEGPLHTRLVASCGMWTSAGTSEGVGSRPSWGPAC